MSIGNVTGGGEEREDTSLTHTAITVLHHRANNKCHAPLSATDAADIVSRYFTTNESLSPGLDEAATIMKHSNAQLSGQKVRGQFNMRAVEKMGGAALILIFVYTATVQ